MSTQDSPTLFYPFISPFVAQFSTISTQLGAKSTRSEGKAFQLPFRKDRGKGPQLGAFGTRSYTGGIQFNSGIGGESLVDLHNQILTLKETIISLEPILKEDSVSENMALKNGSSMSDPKGSPEGKAFENDKGSLGKVSFEIEDYIKLQEEYNKLIFKKHQV